MIDIILFVIILIGLIYALFWEFPKLYRHIEGETARSLIARYRARQWYNPPKGKGDEEDETEEWSFIENVLLLKKDPLIVSKPMRQTIRKESKQFLLIILALLIGVGAFGQHVNAVELIVRFTGTVMVVGAILYIIIKLRARFNMIRVKGRASSRQNWIKDVRVILAELASSMPTPDLDEALRQCQRSKSEHKFRELELHLNPSEKMHRSLLYAINLAYDADWLKDDEVEKNLRLGNTEDRHDGKLQAGIIRLSQVVLKREWEQTKKLR